MSIIILGILFLRILNLQCLVLSAPGSEIPIPGTLIPRLPGDTNISSVLELFDFGFFFNQLLVLFLLVSLFFELLILFALVQRVRTYGLKGFMLWLDELLGRAIKTPALLIVAVFSLLLLIILWVVIATQGNSIAIISEHCHSNSQGIIKIQEVIDGCIK
jgi:hypothetical protein